MRRAFLIAASVSLALLAAALAMSMRGNDETPGTGRMTVSAQDRFVVFDWSRDACDSAHLPDLPARAFRDAEGKVQLLTAHYVNRRFVGRDFDNLRPDCAVVMRSADSPGPAAFAGRGWLAAPYTLDGRTVYALVHNEFQGHRRPDLCPSETYERCWYNALTLAVSRDGGRSYLPARTRPNHLVAAYPARYKPDVGPVGYFGPSNIVRNRRDEYYYVVAHVIGPGNRPRGACIMRTRRLDEPSSWRGWDGRAFGVRFQDPYRSEPSANDVCRPVAHDSIEEMTQSLTYSTYFQRFLLVGTASLLTEHGRAKWGIHYSLSRDLVHWTSRRLIMRVETPWTYRCGDPDPVLYPSVIDPQSPTRNFETTGRRAYLYLTQLHYEDCQMGPDRDLVRFRLDFARDQVVLARPRATG